MTIVQAIAGRRSFINPKAGAEGASEAEKTAALTRRAPIQLSRKPILSCVASCGTANSPTFRSSPVPGSSETPPVGCAANLEAAQADVNPICQGHNGKSARQRATM
jgi:hypothetical protein